MRTWFAKKDFFLCFAVLLIALLFWLGFGRGTASAREARLYIDGELVQAVSLTEDGSFSLETLPAVVFEISDGRIRFASSDCPDQICVQTGFIAAPGAYAVCLPHRLMLQIPPDDNTPDAVTGALPGQGGLS